MRADDTGMPSAHVRGPFLPTRGCARTPCASSIYTPGVGRSAPSSTRLARSAPKSHSPSSIYKETDGDAGTAHVTSSHFATAMAALPEALVATPKIISQTVAQRGWDELGE